MSDESKTCDVPHVAEPEGLRLVCPVCGDGTSYPMSAVAHDSQGDCDYRTKLTTNLFCVRGHAWRLELIDVGVGCFLKSVPCAAEELRKDTD